MFFKLYKWYQIGQRIAYVYCNSMLTRLWRHKFGNWHYLSNQAIFCYMIKNSRHKFKYLENEKSIFHNFQWPFIKTNKNNFFGRWESDFNSYCMPLRESVFSKNTSSRLATLIKMSLFTSFIGYCNTPYWVAHSVMSSTVFEDNFKPVYYLF